MSSIDPFLRNDASVIVQTAHTKSAQTLPFADQQDFSDAQRGFLGTVPDATAVHASGRTVWSMAPYAFQNDDTPPLSVHPSLWRQSRLNLTHGLFEVVPGVYQVRGFDIANMTLVEGVKGVIVVDTLTSIETAKAALALYRAHRGDRPVTAVIYTHTHIDHWGGSKGVADPADVAAGRIAVIAPDGFMEHTVAENVFVGNAMLRRAMYQFGRLLPPGPRGHVDCGLGKTMATGTVSLIPPTTLITKTGETRTIDGVTFVFQMAPDSEAPAEMHFFLPERKVLCLAENATHTFHNLLPFRGSQVRNSRAWSGYLAEALELWGAEVDVLIGQHHWPVWDNARVVEYVSVQRDLYKYVHDQTVRMMNHGLNASEIAEAIELPPSIAQKWYTRDYYGALKHNAKAIYQHYLGWYDANPANLDPLPTLEAAKKTIDYMGGVDAVVGKAARDFAAGDYRWVAQVMSQAVFADPTHVKARALLADTFEQLGYLAESSTWRNAYLFGAHELRHGMPKLPGRTPVSPDTLAALSTSQLFDTLAIRLNGPKAFGRRITLDWTLTDTAETAAMTLENATLNHVMGRHARKADATMVMTRAIFNAIATDKVTFLDAIKAGEINVAGDGAKAAELFSLLDVNTRMFEIVEPRQKPHAE
jgi:alkyl sulfatase BDS1-like metallo-beta-lactamase superfamily hydrolase